MNWTRMVNIGPSGFMVVHFVCNMVMDVLYAGFFFTYEPRADVE